jgi:predicted TIM-barrel fold metal-dependent hydrolase
MHAIDADGHVMELIGTSLPDYLDEPYRSRARTAAADWDGAGSTFAWLPGDCWDRNLGSALFKGRGNTADDWLQQMEKGPLDLAVLYPSFLLMIGCAYDADWSVALCRAYNRWVAAHIVGEGEGRLHAVAVLPPQDADEAERELRAAAELGLVAGMFPADGVHLLGDRRYDRVWTAAEELDVPIAVHAAGTHLSGRAFPKFVQTHTFNHPASVMAQLTSMMFQGVFSRHPALRVGYLEVGATWAPWYLDRMDEEYELRGDVEAPELLARPSSYVGPEGNIFFGLEAEERLLGPVLDLIGPSAMYASDWPHWDGDYPESLHQLAERRDLSDEHRRGVLVDAARRFYGFA